LARLSFANLIRDIDLVVFDKDGTLIDFDFTWGPRAVAAVDALIAERSSRIQMRDRLLTSIGVDPATQRARPESPFVVGTLSEVVIVAATVLYQSGESWTDATLSAERHVRRVMALPPSPAEIRAFPAVAPLFAMLRAAGVAVGVLTNDDRNGTMATLDHLGLTHLVSATVCADDGRGVKPEPDGLIHLAHSLSVPIERVAMVGDATGDLVTAKRAGAGLAIGVLSGVAGRARLEAHADVLLDHVGHIVLADG